MKRRGFVKTGSLLAAPLFLRGIPVMAARSTGNPMMDALARSTNSCGKILVIIQQNGGNDGLNTILPADQWSNLVNARSNILMDQSSTLALNNNINTVMHPALAEMRNMYNDGKIMIVQGVSYPNPSFSHFRATDIWFSASDSNVNLNTGWLGRSLDTQYPGYPANYPNTTMPDPLAIQIGSTLPFSLQGPNMNMGYSAPDPNSLLNVINGITDPAPNNDYGKELSFLRLMKDQSNVYRTVIQNAYNVSQSQTATYPSPNLLADQLKIVAKLINGGLQTPIYIVNHPNSHDTHSDQVDATDKTAGTQADLLKILSQAINAFQADLELMGKANLVTGMTFSEFGRRIKSNSSEGTDHGTAAPVMFFGAALNTNPAVVAGTSQPIPGMIGTSPVLPISATVNDQIPMQFDFRQLYATVMQDWLCMSDTDTQAVLGSAFSRLPIFTSSAVLSNEPISLTGQYYGGQSKLTYRVENNAAFESFAIEFSQNGTEFSEISRIQNVSLNSSEGYFYNHTINVKRMYYRIAARDRQGAIKYSPVLMLRSNAREQLISVYPNPITNQTINIKFHEAVNTHADVTIFTMEGQKVYYNRFNQAGTSLSFRVPPLSNNVHFVLEVVYGGSSAHEQIMFR